MNNELALQTAVIPLASITADGDVYGMYLPRKSKIVSALLVNGAGIAQSDTDKAVITLQEGSNVIATHSTALTGGTSALSANVPAAMTLNSSHAGYGNGGVTVAAGKWLKVAYDESGTYAMTSAFVIVNYYPL
jgi:hypothetical protein